MSPFPADPSSSALTSHPIWQPQLFAATVIVVSAPDGFDIAPPIDPGALTAVGATAEDGFHALIAAEGGPHRLWFPEGGQPIQAAILIPFDAHFSERVLSIQRFHRWLTGRSFGPWPRWQRFSRYQIHRFSLMLRAWDGAQAGAPRQEIASLLLNSEVGKLRSIDWKNRPERRRLHRLLKAGQQMIDGGYLRLLRPEARSGRGRLIP